MTGPTNPAPSAASAPAPTPPSPPERGRRSGRSGRLGRILAVLAGGILFLLAWELVVLIGGYKPFILPDPPTVFSRFVQAWTQGTMGPNVLATLQEIALGFVVGVAAGLVAGYVLARSRIANLVLSPYLVAAQSTPILALAPLFALWFGSGLLTVVIICALIVFFPVAVSTLVGLRSVDAGLVELARSLRATRRQVLVTLEVPAALPSVMGGIRVGVTLAVVGAIIGEWAGAARGLGYLINLARGSLFDIPLMFATLLMTALLGVGFYGLTVLIERRLVGDRD
jgi:NitT/TauT family transport system permease protein